MGDEKGVYDLIYHHQDKHGGTRSYNYSVRALGKARSRRNFGHDDDVLQLHRVFSCFRLRCVHLFLSKSRESQLRARSDFFRTKINKKTKDSSQ